MDLQLENADVIYYTDYIENDVGQKIFDDISTLFHNIECQSVAKSNGDEYKLNRKTLVFIDPSSVDIKIIPKIWGATVTIIPFSEDLLTLRAKLEKDLKHKFNICLANYYTTGKKSIGWHADNEEKGSISCIASLSLGAERIFEFRKNVSIDSCKTINLQNNSLLVMGKGCQENYQHRLPKNKSCTMPRLNLTFRLFDEKRYVNM
jgi:hypothetical protein